jgi:hypothetical protein
MSIEKLYLLQNCTAGYVGNSPVFWRKGGAGYTQWVEEAERFTYKAARQIVRSTRGSHSWEIWPEEMVVANLRSTVDIQALRRARDEKRAKRKRKPREG